MRPAHLEIEELGEGRLSVFWKQPATPVGRLAIDARLPERCADVGERQTELAVGYWLQRWSADCGAEGLAGGTIRIAGLGRTLTDVLLRIHFADGESITALIRPERPALVVERRSGAGLAAYLRLGIEHLVFGWDHILFIVGLTLFVRRPLALVKVITGFTVAHSITLALSALGVVRLPQVAVEAVVALSILFLACELLQPVGERASLTRRRPWLIAFAFGLLHGFGFAGALADVGLPPKAVAPALLLFNVGVEIGQLIVVALVLALAASWRQLRLPTQRWVLQAPVWAMGTFAAYWFVVRIAGML